MSVCSMRVSAIHSVSKGSKMGFATSLRASLAGLRPLYFHKVKILVGAEQFETMAGFSPELSVGGILGRRGFFENFIVRIDSSTTPPVCDIEKIHRA